LLLLPFIITGIFLLIASIEDLTRYNQDYFNDGYQARYAVPSSLITDLENALRSGDETLLAKLQGTRHVPRNMESKPNLRFMIFWEYNGKYSEYLFIDTSNYHRHMQHLKEVNGRYIRVPDGLYYLANSGLWLSTFGPIAVFWWLVVILFTLGIWFYRSMAAYRQRQYSDHDPERNQES
jgi:hypothetical protein